MKRILLLSLVWIGMISMLEAQTIVGTDPENKNVVLEEFTGIHCGFCPDGHAIAQGIYNAHPEDVVLINIHVGSYAVPGAGEPDFRTPWGSAIEGQSGLVGYPAGTVNRHLFPGMSQGSGTAMNRGSWSSAANQTLALASYLNVGCEATIITSTRQLVVNVEVYYTGDSPLATNFLNVAILQNNILGPQTNGGAGNNYNHMHMLRHLLTGQWGITIPQTTTGTLYSTTLYYEIPEDYTDVDVVLENLDIAAFVTESHQEVVSGTLADIQLVESLDLDAGIVDYNIPQTSCGSEMNPKVTIKNFGTENLTALTFDYAVNEGTPESYTWTGNLAQNQTAIVELPTIVFDGQQSNTISINAIEPNNQNDELPANNDLEFNFEKTTYLPQNCKVAILTDGNPEETTWDIKNSAGEIIASGGPYTMTSIFLEPFEWTGNDCYIFTIYDAGGDGLDGGFYKIVNSGTQLIWQGTNNFGTEASAEFAYDELMKIEIAPTFDQISVFPNPVIENANIDFTLLQQSTVQLGVYNIIGKRVIEVYRGRMAAGKQNFSINTDDLESGVYFIHLDVDGILTTEKIHIIK